MLTNQLNCIPMMEYKLTLPKYNLGNTRFAEQSVSRKVGFMNSAWKCLFSFCVACMVPQVAEAILCKGINCKYCSLLQKYRICTYISRTFLTNLSSKIEVRLMHGILFPFDDLARDASIVCCENPSRLLVLETVILQAIAYMQIRQRITGILAYFDYMRVADTINSQKSEDCDITDKLP
jgi:hypothetical protein